MNYLSDVRGSEPWGCMGNAAPSPRDRRQLACDTGPQGGRGHPRCSPRSPSNNVDTSCQRQQRGSGEHVRRRRPAKRFTAPPRDTSVEAPYYPITRKTTLRSEKKNQVAPRHRKHKWQSQALNPLSASESVNFTFMSVQFISEHRNNTI